MNKKEFLEKWFENSTVSGLRIIRFNGGSMFCSIMSINEINEKRNGKEDLIYDEVQLSNVAGGVWVEIGTIRLDKIIEVL